MLVGAGSLREAEMFHAGKTGAIREGERLVFILQHPIPRLGKEPRPDPAQGDDARMVQEVKKTPSLVGYLSRHEK